MSTSPYRWLVVVGVAVALVGCEQDPLRIPHLPDGGALDAAEDAFMPDMIAVDSNTEPDVRPDLSYDACITQIEVCNGVDDNCNSQVDEGFDKLNDARFCEDCKGCKELLTKDAIPGCKAGKCMINSCKAGFVDADGDISNGCEYNCTPSGVEVCDGIDNDCNDQIDEGVQLTQQICKSLGACAGATAECKGKDGWVCQYGADVELQPCTKDEDCGTGNLCGAGNVCPNLVIVDEQRCDNKDGDCDGLADDPWANPALPEPLGAECVPVPTGTCTDDSQCDPPAGRTCNTSTGICTEKQGICKDAGMVTCKADGTGSECTQTQSGVNPGTEVCNGKDDDCDGQVDDNLTDEQWVNIGTVQIFKYEASRPDATGSAAGILSNGRPCSVPGRLPWASVSRQEAADACTRAGGRLCSTAEWIKACQGQSNLIYPYGNTFDPSKCNGRAYDLTKDEVLTTDKPSICVSNWGGAGTILNMSGNLKEWAKASGTSYELKGGAYDTPSIPGAGAGLSCTYQLPAPTTTLRLPTLGFRCCK